MKLSRKQFLRMGAAAGATVSLLIIGCGSDDSDDSGTGGSGGSSGSGGAGGSGGGTGSPCTADIVANHGHVLDIPAADLDSTTDKSYNIQGAAAHPHTLTFTAAQLAQLKGGTAVSLTSTTDAAHSHDVTVTCV